MSGWSGLLVMAALTGGADVTAAQSIHANSCTILGELTRRHTLRRLDVSTGQFDDGRGRQPVEYSLPQACDQTANAVSRGFSAAMAQFGLPVRWSAFNGEAGCESRDIDRCYPVAHGADSATKLQATGAMAEAWREVQYVISAFMPWGSQSDLSHFTADFLWSAYGSAGRPKAGSISIEPAPGNVW